EFVRSWGIQLITEDGSLNAALRNEFISLAKSDPSPVVRRYLASAVQKMPSDFAWQLTEVLAQHGEDRNDRNIPYLLWHGMATQWSRNPATALDRALAIAGKTNLPQLADWIQWYAATQ